MMQIKTSKQKRADRKTAIGIGVLFGAVAILIVFVTVFLPILSAWQGFHQRMDLLTSGEAEAVLLTQPSVHGIELLPTSVEVYLEGDAAEEIRRGLISAFKKASYLGEEPAPAGDWEIRVRLSISGSGESVQLSLREDEIYYSVDGVRHRFAPKGEAGRAEYRALYDGVVERLEEKIAEADD